jgi:hypothetical protein
MDSSDATTLSQPDEAEATSPTAEATPGIEVKTVPVKDMKSIRYTMPSF